MLRRDTDEAAAAASLADVEHRCTKRLSQRVEARWPIGPDFALRNWTECESPGEKEES
jgi:hypothetical protein